MKTVAKHRRDHYVWHKIVIAMIGVVLSVVLHELFHILIHWGQIESIRFFQGASIAEIIVTKHSDSNLVGEEFIAYAITLLVIFVTVMTIFKVHDTTDPRTVRQILSEDSQDLQKMKSSEFEKLVGKTDLGSPQRKTRSKSKSVKK